MQNKKKIKKGCGLVLTGPCFQCILWGIQSCNSFDCLRRSPWHTEENWECLQDSWSTEPRLAGAGGWQPAETAHLYPHPVPLPWSALADIGFPLSAECLRTRTCQERTSLAHLWLSLVTASGMSLPGDWGSSCLGSNTAGLTLGHICPQKWFGWTGCFNVPPMFLPSLSHLGWCQPRDLF